MELRKIAFYVAIVFGIISAICGFLFPDQIIKIFVTPTDEVKQIAIIAIKIYFIAFITMGANIVLGGYFQAIEMSKIAIFISLLRGLVIVGAMIFILPIIFGVNGIWLSVPLTEVITFGIALYVSKKTLKVI